MYQFEIDIVMFLTSDASYRANLIDWCAGSWAGFPDLSFTFISGTFLCKRRLCKDIQLWVSKKIQTSLTGMWESCTESWANDQVWWDLPSYKDQAKGTLAFQSVSAQVS